MENFTLYPSIFGGLLIGRRCALLLRFAGCIIGVGGISSVSHSKAETMSLLGDGGLLQKLMVAG